MNGSEKITARIDADTQAEIDRILGDANAQAEAIGAKYRAQAEAEDADLLAKGQRAAAEREERLISAAQMEARKSLLTVKQELVERAYQRALEKLCTLPRDVYKRQTVPRIKRQMAVRNSAFMGKRFFR